jgi:hypothetical protein
MKTRKTVSAKIVAANRRNASKSTGAKTVSGKANSKLNAIKHGLFARELSVSAEEMGDFEALRRDLTAQLAPKSELQKLAVDEILFCTWRCKLAGRWEMRLLHSTAEDAPTAGSNDQALMTGWYAATRQNIRAGVRFLFELREDVQTHGRVREFFKDRLVNAFGSDFYDQLTVWIPINVDAIYMADQLVNHAKNYNLPLPELETKPKVVVDLRERLQMALKLIAQEARHLEDLDRSFENRFATSRAGPTTDFAPRFFSSASRDLHRAIEWFAHLKRQHM